MGFSDIFQLLYFAVRDAQKNYKGVIEMSQDITDVYRLYAYFYRNGLFLILYINLHIRVIPLIFYKVVDRFWQDTNDHPKNNIQIHLQNTLAKMLHNKLM